MRAGAELADGSHQQIADSRVSAEKVFQLVEDVIPVELLFVVVVIGSLDIFAVVLFISQLAEEDVGEISGIVDVHGGSVLVDDGLDDELADVRAPRLELLHVAAVDGHEPGQEIDSVALVDVPENLIKETDDFAEFLVVVVEASAAHVVGEDVGAHGHHRRLQIDAFAGRRRRHERQFVDHQVAFGRQDAAESVELHRIDARVAPVAGDRAAISLQVRPIAQGQR